MSEGIPSVETEYSRAGTAAHAVCEMALRRNVDPDLWLGLEVEGVEVDDGMVEACQVFVNYCRQIPGEKSWIERQISLAPLNPPGPMFGTPDFMVYDAKTRTLEVPDFKFGSGVVVEIEGNPQPPFYALGAALEMEKEGLPVDLITMTIVQPRAFHPDGVIRSKTITYLELFEFAGELLEAARRTGEPDAPLVSGSHCRFCPAAAVCPALREQSQMIAQVAFDAMPLDVPPAPESIPPEVFEDFLDKMPILEHWIAAYYAEANRRGGRGELKNYKVVPKRPTRKWVSPAQVERWAEGKGLEPDELYVQKLKSPAQLEKVVGKKNLPAELVVKISSGTTLAPISDPRPAVALDGGEAFAALPPASE